LRRLVLVVACCLVVAGCGNDSKKAADLAHYRAEQRALVELATMQSLLAEAQRAFDAGHRQRAANLVADAVDGHYPPIQAPLRQADADLESSLRADLAARLLGGVGGNVARRPEIDRLFEQIQADLLTAADALRA
jgi:hypothetical protein